MKSDRAFHTTPVVVPGVRTDETARDGLGLGLFVSRQIVEMQGGRIWAESTVGEGTTVTFTLPLANTQKAD